MSDLIVVGFPNKFEAEEALLALRKMEKEHLIDLEDAAIVVKNDKGKVKIKQSQDLISEGTLSGSMWGALIGLLFLEPLLGLAIGAASGALGGALQDIGVNDSFMKELGETLQPGCSALFILVRQATMDKVIEELQPLNGKILHTSLSKADEAILEAAIEKVKTERV